MKSLEERHAERERRRKEGPGPVVIEKDPETETASLDEEEREPMRNKRPGSSKEQPGAEAKVEGDDTINSGFTFGVATETADSTVVPRATRTLKSGSSEAGGNGGGGWKAPKA